MRYFFVFNPGSRNGKSGRFLSRLRGLLDDRGVDYEYAVTKSLCDAHSLSRKANLSGYDVVAAVGGDGTINKVLNGFYDNNGLRLSSAKLGVIYTGTSPDFCKSYRLPYDDIEQSLDVLLAGRIDRIQIGKITLAPRSYQELNGKTVKNDSDFVSRYFSCCVNIGLGVHVARYANAGVRKVFGDYLGTFCALAKAFILYRPCDLTVSCDGKAELLSHTYNLSVGKTFHVASGIKVNNSLSEGDNRFYTLIVRNVGWEKIPFCLKTIYSGKEISDSDTICLKYAKTVDVYGDSSNYEVEFDGDPQGFLPCRIEMAKDKLELINEAG